MNMRKAIPFGVQTDRAEVVAPEQESIPHVEFAIECVLVDNNGQGIDRKELTSCKRDKPPQQSVSSEAILIC
jgi:hypothetical protein